MNESKRCVVPWIIAVAAVIAALITAMMSGNDTEYESKSSQHMDSLSATISADDVTISRLSARIDSMKASSVSISDSASENKKSSEKSVKIVIRTVYRDSVREVYVEKTEAMEEYQRTLTTLKDSISILNARLLASAERKDTSSVKEAVRSETTEKSESVKKKADRPGAAGMTAGARVHPDKSISKEIRGYVTRKIIGPVFVGADAYWETGDSFQGTAGAGVILGPFRGYLGAGYDGEPCAKASVSADFTF